MDAREDSHAGSWYSDDKSTLSYQLDHWLQEVPDEIEGIGQLPVPGARMIIAPHAGYAYSGRCAAFAYKALDLSQAKRIFVVGPSHHHYFTTLALPEFTSYHTPLSDDPLPLDTEFIAKLRSTRAGSRNGLELQFTTMSRSVDEAEHSIELHLPYIHRLLQRQRPNQPTSEYPPLVPILVGAVTESTEKAFGALLAPYIDDPENAFVISSDFCHWGQRFRYTSREPPIHESISAVDLATMAAITTGEYARFSTILKNTGNTVCGRHPIGVIMAGIEEIRKNEGEKGRFHFIRYDRSSNVIEVDDSSVSYVSAFTVL
ncbi:uncharacterized protein An07g08630 [Aspergillus niger]|uniref:Contig An07c0280, genomic contig n=2 Tax=Aspergillus niger TaxID=5061 RepID=A2QP92_ASPNC|nr:uncharacterized protein An07g08630 [Aspergillus niger]CAK39657.1 unnamed protein product [Aspergillus niger]